MTADILFSFFVVKDGEMNDGSQNKPYYMSHRLKYMLKENVKKEEIKLRKAQQ